MGWIMWDNSFLRKRTKEARKVELLEKAVIFQGLSRKELYEVEKVTYDRSYQPGEYIFRKGNPGDGMYIIMEGGVQIVDERGDKGDEVTLIALSDGDFFGEIALLDESARSASAKCTKPTQVIGFFRGDLIDLLNRRPIVGSKIILSVSRVLGERLRKTNDRVNVLEAKLSEMTND